ncbi:MAG: CDP-diacylglycerol--glycerol-3-phosphate 3-phosphatidyltransferase [Phycisphaerales bacterium]|nr:CDP-diacylglycerol--glycerol-3-phosphate 3-phosphatidyltransferase [Phycisphaerales bacterium]
MIPVQPPAPAAPPSPLLPPWKRNLPNLLTASRCLLAILFFAVLSTWSFERSPAAASPHVADWRLIIAAAVFIIAAATDALDGHLARKWHAVSPFGRVMDPFADKLLVLGAFVYLAAPSFEIDGFGQATSVAPWMVVVVLGRELLVTSIRSVLEGAGVPFPATASGKWKMILQSICIPLVLLLIALAPLRELLPTPSERVAAEWRPTAAYWAITISVYLTVLVTLWSGLPYILRGYDALKATP